MLAQKFTLPKHTFDGDLFLVEGSKGTNQLLQIVLDDYPADDPRGWDNIGTMICWHRNYKLGDTHNHEDAESLLQSLLREAIADGLVEPRDIIRYVLEGKTDTVQLRYDEGEWNLYSYDDYFGKWYLEEGFRSLDESFYTGAKPGALIADVIVGLLPVEVMCELLQSTYFMLPLDFYEHSSCTIKIGTWDGRQDGVIYVSKKKVFDEQLSLLNPELENKIPGVDYDRNDIAATRIPANDENWCDIANHYLRSEVRTYDDYISGAVFGYKLYDLDETLEDEDRYDTTLRESIESVWGFIGSTYDWNGILDGFRVKEIVA